MRSSERDKDPALFLEEQKNNLIIARDIMGLSKARLVYAKKGHGCNIEIVKEASELESKEGLFLVAGYIFESSSDMLSPSEMKDILYPLGEDEGLDDHYRKMRSEIFDYDGVAANLYWQAPDYSNSLDDISVAEKKVIARVGYRAYADSLNQASSHPLIATAKERVHACILAWSTTQQGD